MKINDAFFAFITGVLVAWVASDFLPLYSWVFFILLPIFSVCLLDLTDKIFKDIFIVRQAARFVLVGGFADIIDIKAFQILILLVPSDLLIKSVSFLAAVAIKYFGNKIWVFNKHGGQGINREVAQFVFVTVVGLGINVASFYFFDKIDSGIGAGIWAEISVILAALAASVWNFLGYKFLVFKNNGSIIQKI